MLTARNGSPGDAAKSENKGVATGEMDESSQIEPIAQVTVKLAASTPVDAASSGKSPSTSAPAEDLGDEVDARSKARLEQVEAAKLRLRSLHEQVCNVQCGLSPMAHTLA